MDIQAELRLSFYREIGILDQEHGVSLVQHVETQKVYVRKTLTIYDTRVFQYLMAHPVSGVPKIQELVESQGTLYVIEEYISGTSLRETLDTAGKLPPSVALGYLRQLCDILRPLHRLQAPIVHRDIKPSNIIIAHTGQLYLVDFNAAKEAADAKGRDTVLIGTFGYAAPEQYGFSASQPTTDIYALGVLLNEMLTGKLPQEEMAGGPLAAVIQKCLQMEPLRRYQNVDQLLQEAQSGSAAPCTEETRADSWRLPGFRSRKFFRWVLAVLWYAFGLLISLSIVVEGVGPGEQRIFRIAFFVAFFLETLWVGNYRDVWEYFPLSGSENRRTCVLGVACWGLALFVAILMLAAAVANAFGL